RSGAALRRRTESSRASDGPSRSARPPHTRDRRTSRAHSLRAKSIPPPKGDALAATLAALEALGEEEGPPPPWKLVPDYATENVRHCGPDTIGTIAGRRCLFRE